MSGCRALLLVCSLSLLGCSSPAPSFVDQRAANHNRAGAEAFQRGDLEAAALHFERALELGAALADRPAQADARNNLGIVYESIGRLEDAGRMYTEALQLSRPDSRRRDAFVQEYPGGVLAAALNLTRIATVEGDFDKARTALQDAEGAARELATGEAKVDVAKQRAALAAAERGAAADVLDLAEAAVKAAERLEQSAANRVRQADAHIVLARVLLARGAVERALSAANTAAQLARAGSERSLIAVGLELLAEIDVAAGRYTEARERLALALDVHVRRPNSVSARRTLQRLIDVAGLEGRTELVETYRSQLTAL